MTKRISYEQRQRLLAFMQGHEDLARGRVAGPDAARTKKLLLGQLAEELNAMGSGSTKSPEKWLKCWQDWKSDTKAKYLRIKKARAGTGGGPSPAPLSPLEETLLTFYGMEMVEGLQGVLDPLEASEAPPPSPPLESQVFSVEEVLSVPTEPIEVPIDEVPQRRRVNNDPLSLILERQAAALENLAAAVHEIASAMHAIAIALKPAQ